MIAICLGGAVSVWGDYARAVELLDGAPHIVVACNYAGIKFDGQLDAWCTLHPERFEPWKAERAKKGLNTDYRSFIYKARRGVDSEVVPYRWKGSSGLYMAQIAIDHLGAIGAILCGVPMDDTGSHINHGGEWRHQHHYRDAFLQARTEGLNVRSMSGWSAELFGSPDADWIAAVARGEALLLPTLDPEFQRMRIKMKVTVNFTPRSERRISMKYLVDQEYTVRRAWGEEMVSRGKATEIKAPSRKAANARGG